MKHKIKSYTEISKEIKELFDKNVNEKELSTSLDNYIAGITGHELIDKNEIENIVSNETAYRIIVEKRKFSQKFMSKYSNKRQSLSLKKIINVAKNLYPDKKNNIEELLIEYFKDISDDVITIASVCYNLHLDIIKTCPKYNQLQKKILNDPNKYTSIECELAISFKNLIQLLTEDSKIAFLFTEYVFYKKRNIIVDLVNKKIVPLNTMFIYFDTKINIKQNIERLYVMLNKKIPRNTIQLAIKRELPKIKKGKYSVPIL